MLKNLIVLLDGTRISSGAGESLHIRDLTLTQCVNSGAELTIGSVCSACVEATIAIPPSGPTLSSGDIFVLYKVDDEGNETSLGHFFMEKPTRRSANLYRITAYDSISLTDIDLSEFVKGLDGWPYRLGDFAELVCDACGLMLVSKNFPNSDFQVHQFYKSGITGRQILGWIGEIAGRFCRADSAGDVEFGWYTDDGITVEATGDRYYFGSALTYEDYEVAPIDGVQIRLADGEGGALWPTGDYSNPYIITGNPILLARVVEELEETMLTILDELKGLPAYRPCKVSLPVSLDIAAGNLITVVDKNGKQIPMLVMAKTQTRQRDTLECTGSAKRTSPTAINNQSSAQVAQQAVDSQTRQEIFDKLTEGGKIQGIYVQDGKWYVNAEHVQVLNLKAGSITAGKLSSVNGKTYFDLDNGTIVTNNITATGGIIGGCSIVGGVLKVPAANITGTLTVAGTGGNVFTAGDGKVSLAGWEVDYNSIRHGSLGASGSMWLCRTGTNSSPNSYGQSGIAETAATKTGWCITVGNKFGVDRTGALFASGATLIGTIKASAGNIGEWSILENGTLSSDHWGYVLKMNGRAIAITYATGTDSQGNTVEVTEQISWKDLILTVKSLM